MQIWSKFAKAQYTLTQHTLSHIYVYDGYIREGNTDLQFGVGSTSFSAGLLRTGTTTTTSRPLGPLLGDQLQTYT